MAANNYRTLLMSFGAVLALSGCGNGADRVASPGEGAFPPAPAPAPTPAPAPSPTPAPPPSGGPAEGCPSGFTDIGTVADGGLRACRLPQLITGNLTVPRRDGTVYAISGSVNVGQDQGGDAGNPHAVPRGVLTVEPGVTVFASSGNDYLIVNRGSEIHAEGTAEAPIVFTARQDIEGETGPDTIGLWGGLILAGRAPINACPGETQSGTPQCQSQVEGTNAFYGGNAPSDSSGVIRYVQVKYSGFEISPNNELQGITAAGAGSGTTLEYFQIHNSSDDGIEIFGGTLNARYLVVTGADDDSIDTDTGWNGGIQFGIVIQRAGGGDRMNEWSSINRQPYSQPRVANITYVGRPGGGAAIHLNQGTQASFYNSVVTRAAGGTGSGERCLEIRDANTTGTFHSVHFSCPVAFEDARAQEAFESGTNNVVGTSSLVNGFVNGPQERAVPAYQGLEAAHPFFRQVDYIGGVRDASDTWWQGWTCGLTQDAPAC
ncbi:hypothetical protein [Luteimonas huabeiensis]|uniref:hypothetical protein n=1 Tax=Luteimonas huabeiensis TaxID=1244513 RepID=UPI000467E828|nr:hypothetical protein [Luteimonas huabeiensis]